MWLGIGFNGGNAYFGIPNDSIKDYAEGVYDAKTKLVHFRNCIWFTNIDIQKRHTPMDLYMRYHGNEEHYPKYDNYDAINVDKTCEIPEDYNGVMGVPITFLDKYCPEQFEVLGIANSARWIGYECYTIINSKKIYNRILIQRRDNR